MTSTHYGDVIMGAIASQITSLTIVYSTVCSDADQRNYQSSASLTFVRGIHRGPVNSPHTWPVTRKIFPFDDVIICCREIKFIFSETNVYSATRGHFYWQILCKISLGLALGNIDFSLSSNALCHPIISFDGAWNVFQSTQGQPFSTAVHTATFMIYRVRKTDELCIKICSFVTTVPLTFTLMHTCTWR